MERRISAVLVAPESMIWSLLSELTDRDWRILGRASGVAVTMTSSRLRPPLGAGAASCAMAAPICITVSAAAKAIFVGAMVLV